MYSEFARYPLSLPQTPIFRSFRSTICNPERSHWMGKPRITNGGPERARKRTLREREGRSCKHRIGINGVVGGQPRRYKYGRSGPLRSFILQRKIGPDVSTSSSPVPASREHLTAAAPLCTCPRTSFSPQNSCTRDQRTVLTRTRDQRTVLTRTRDQLTVLKRTRD